MNKLIKGVLIITILLLASSIVNLFFTQGLKKKVVIIESVVETQRLYIQDLEKQLSLTCTIQDSLLELSRKSLLTYKAAKEVSNIEVLTESQKRRIALQHDYVERFAETAIRESKLYGIPTSIILGQGILESAAGTSLLSENMSNHFGVKCGKTVCDHETNPEFYSGKCMPVSSNEDRGDGFTERSKSLSCV